MSLLAPAGGHRNLVSACGRTDMEEITEEAAELVARVAALDIGKASLVACVRVPHETRECRRPQEARPYATSTGSLLELQDRLVRPAVRLRVMDATSTFRRPP